MFYLGRVQTRDFTDGYTVVMGIENQIALLISPSESITIGFRVSEWSDFFHNKSLSTR